MSKNTTKNRANAKTDDPAGPEQVEGGVQPENAEPLTREDHGSYADEANRSNGSMTYEQFKDAMRMDMTEQQGRELQEKYPEFARQLRAEDEADLSEPEAVGQRGGESAADMKARLYEHVAAHSSKAGPSDTPPAQLEAAEARKGFAESKAPEDDKTREPRGNQGAPQAPGPFSSRPMITTAEHSVQFRPTIGRVVHVVLAAHSTFRRRPVNSAEPTLAMGEIADPAATGPRIERVLEPLPAIVTHVDDDGFAVEVFGARERVKETFRYDYYGDQPGQWMWPPRA
jgi:hypothetical protein